MGEDIDRYPCVEVLPPCFLQAEFGGPLHIVAFVQGVDARFFDFQPVVRLHGLEFEHPGACKVGGDDIGRYLAVGSRGGADGEAGLAGHDGHAGAVGFDFK
ncbi:MAG: hypothetical protein FD137_2649 [Spirochaetes bacterium]|nr:MAG: hypothetical protein FD137_2649 [Spirochaetota bacterium]